MELVDGNACRIINLQMYIYISTHFYRTEFCPRSAQLCSKGVSPGGATSSVSAEETKQLLLDYPFALPPLWHQLDYSQPHSAS
jgi:hypothetical protein